MKRGAFACLLLLLTAPGVPAATQTRLFAGGSLPTRYYVPEVFAGARAAASPVTPAIGARGLIVPHHWVAGRLIISGLRDLNAGVRPELIVLIGPNHRAAGAGAPVQTSKRDWSTSFGRVRPDKGVIESLVRNKLAVVSDQVLAYEHSIGGIIPAIAAEVPGARVVPLAIHDLRPTEVRELARAITHIIGDRGVVVASIDFAHYITPEESRVRDRETLLVLRSLDSSRVMRFGNEHMDSPASMATLMEVMKRVGATNFDLRVNMNSANILGRAPEGVTSYFYGFYHH